MAGDFGQPTFKLRTRSISQKTISQILQEFLTAVQIVSVSIEKTINVSSISVDRTPAKILNLNSTSTDR